MEETDLFDDEILVKGRRWGGLSEFQDRVGYLVVGEKDVEPAAGGWPGICCTSKVYLR